MILSIQDQLLVDQHTARQGKKEHKYEDGKGNFPYQLTANLHGLLTFTPVFERKAAPSSTYNPLERFHQEPILPTTVCRDDDGTRIFIQSETLASGKKIMLHGARLARRKKKVYDRKNRISENGTTLRHQAINKIKNAVMHKYYSSGGDYAGYLKFFTYTVQAEQYQQLLIEFEQNTKNIQREREIDFTRMPGPYATVKHLDKWHAENKHPDQYYIRHLSAHLENLTKRKTERVESYVWVAEKTKQGTIHFHCILETKYLNAKEESTAWAERCGFPDFQNSVDYGIHRDKNNIENYDTGTQINPGQISSYLTKYVSKNQSRIFGRNYGMSKGFVSHAMRGVEKIFNPEMRIYPKREGQKHQRGAFYFESPWPKWNRYREAWEYPMLCLPVKLLTTGYIEVPTGKVPIYVLKASSWNLVETLFPKLWARSEFLFKRERCDREAYIDQLQVFN